MATLTPFSQSTLLTGVTDPIIRNGICVALCDYWLALMKGATVRTPRERMERLRAMAPSAMSYQKTYANKRAVEGRAEARASMGRNLGHDYEEQTMVMPALLGLQGVRERMIRDLDSLGAAVTWTIEVPGWGRHAIAGFRGLETMMTNMHRASLHVFDPNYGEYVGELQQLGLILRDLWRRDPNYQLISSLSRTTTS